MSKEFFHDLVASQVCLSAIHSFPFLGSDHEVLFDNAWNFKLNVHYSAQQHLDHLISITIELLFDCGKFIRDSRNLITNSLHFRVQLKYITKDLTLLINILRIILTYAFCSSAFCSSPYSTTLIRY